MRGLPMLVVLVELSVGTVFAQEVEPSQEEFMRIVTAR
jgi:hypothetical protein